MPRRMSPSNHRVLVEKCTADRFNIVTGRERPYKKDFQEYSPDDLIIRHIRGEKHPEDTEPIVESWLGCFEQYDSTAVCLTDRYEVLKNVELMALDRKTPLRWISCENDVFDIHDQTRMPQLSVVDYNVRLFERDLDTVFDS